MEANAAILNGFLEDRIGGQHDQRRIILQPASREARYGFGEACLKRRRTRIARLKK